MDMDVDMDDAVDSLENLSLEVLSNVFDHDVPMEENDVEDVEDGAGHIITRGSGSAGSKRRRKVDENQPSEEESDTDEDEDVEAFVLVKILKEDSEIDKHYIKLGLLGEGFFGATYEVVDVNNLQNRLAMKFQTKKGQWSDFDSDTEKELLRLYKEYLILNRILPKHKNIIQIQDFLITPNHVYIVQELCEKLSLNNFFPVADNTSGRRIFKQLVDAIHLMHQYGVVHLDLTSENVLFADSEFMECKIIDFGVSVYRPDWATKVHNNFNPSKWFLDDDELIPSPDATHLDDIKSLGKILHNIMAGKPYASMFLEDYFLEMRTNYKPRFTVFDEAAMNLLELIGPRPFGPERHEDFPTVAQIQQHPWLVGGNSTRAFRNLDTEFALLGKDLTILKVLFKDWVIIPLRIISDESELAQYYQITGNLQRSASDTLLMECTSVDSTTSTAAIKHAMRILYRVGDQSTTVSAVEAAGEPLRIYNELLITLRILPKHEHIVDIRDVLVHREYVLVIRELCGRLTLEDFFAVALNNSARNIFRQLAETVRFMHMFGVVHMDLHCRRIVFTDQQFTNCKIVDFSKARYVPKLAQLAHENFHPGKWITPELSLMSLDASVEVDVRALGRLLHAMMIGIWELDPNSIVNLLGPQAEIFDDAASDLLSKIGPPPFGPDVGQRTLTMDEVCLHTWLADESQQKISPSYTPYT